MFHWRAEPDAAHGGSVVTLGFTDRSPGRGRAPYDGFNLGGHVGDDPETVEANRGEVARRLGLGRERLLFMHQVHGTDVATVTRPWGEEVVECDGVVTAATDLALAVLVADCVPVLLHDAEAGVIGAVHAGRPGMIGGIVAHAATAMRDLGAERIRAVVGPSVCGRCYEVPEDMARAAARISPSAAARTWTGTLAIDVAAGVVDQLVTEGVEVDWVPGCTRELPSLYSYRRDGRTGRFAGVIVRRQR